MGLDCKAAVLRAQGAPLPYADSRPLTVETVTLDPPGPGEVVVKIAGAGLCHSDLLVIEGRFPRETPGVLGHEGSGEVVEIGVGVCDIRVGDHVVFQFSAACGRCKYCLSGQVAICPASREAMQHGELIGGGRRVADGTGKKIMQYASLGLFAEFAVVDRGSVVVIDKSIPLIDTALFGCAVMTGAGAVLNTAKVRAGDKVAIVGLGGVGQNGVMAARLAGAEMIIAMDLDDRKLALARRLGATHAVNVSAPDSIEQVLDLSGGGVDHAIELAGAVAAMKTAWSVLGVGGKLVTAGIAQLGAEIAIPATDLVVSQKSVCGCYMGSCVPVRDIPRFIELQRQGRLPVENLIDGYIGLDEINAGFDRLSAGEALRQILVPHPQ